MNENSTPSELPDLYEVQGHIWGDQYLALRDENSRQDNSAKLDNLTLAHIAALLVQPHCQTLAGQSSLQFVENKPLLLIPSEGG